MLLTLKKLVFKLLELTFGLVPVFRLETRDPVFVNFRLTDREAEAIRKALPAGFTLKSLRFTSGDTEPTHWLSYNFYGIGYPNPRLASVRKTRCEINTFVCGPDGRLGIFVFAGSPFVSRSERPSAIERVCDGAERLVMWLYGCGLLTQAACVLESGHLHVRLDAGNVAMDVDGTVSLADTIKLSDDYALFNDVSFFNNGQTYDLVTVDSAFMRATLSSVVVSHARVVDPFVTRAPDSVFVHRGDIAYVVRALNQTRATS